jgi:hypothetical protein
MCHAAATHHGERLCALPSHHRTQMSVSVPDVDVRLRRPEYTGENRCTPCTVVNVVLAAAASVAVSTVTLPGGVAVACVGALAIYFRGYLVPGTPTLTKRYLPDRVLAAFEKRDDADASTGDGENPAAVLSAAGAVEPCASTADLCLTDSFGAAWRDLVTAVRPVNADADAVADALHTEPTSVSVAERDGAVLAEAGGERVGHWPSRAALVADLAAAQLLRERTHDWDERSLEEQTRVLRGLRVFLDACPSCDGAVTTSADTVESCCRAIDVVAVSCADCGARLLETPVDD